MSEPNTLFVFTGWRPFAYVIVACLALWILAWIFWPTATLWVLAGSAGVVTSLVLGAEFQNRILARQAFLQDLEEERREMVQADLNAAGEVDAATTKPFTVKADLNAAGELHLPDDYDPRRST